MTRYRYRTNENSADAALAAGVAGALGGFAAGMLLAQKVGGLNGIRARLRRRFGRATRGHGEESDLDILREFATDAFADDDDFDEFGEDELEDDAEADAAAAALERRVLGAFLADPVFRERPVDIGAVDHAVIELAGWVQSADERARASTLARRVPGVATVVNDLRVGDPHTRDAEDPAPRT
jgi:BON domain